MYRTLVPLYIIELTLYVIGYIIKLTNKRGDPNDKERNVRNGDED